MVMLKGAGLNDIWTQLLATLGYAIIMNALAVVSYKKVN
jgi:ABC-2 type transport system permease protein